MKIFKFFVCFLNSEMETSTATGRVLGDSSSSVVVAGGLSLQDLRSRLFLHRRVKRGTE